MIPPLGLFILLLAFFLVVSFIPAFVMYYIFIALIGVFALRMLHEGFRKLTDKGSGSGERKHDEGKGKSVGSKDKQVEDTDGGEQSGDEQREGEKGGGEQGGGEQGGGEQGGGEQGGGEQGGGEQGGGEQTKDFQEEKGINRNNDSAHSVVNKYLHEDIWKPISDMVLEANSKDHLNLINSSPFFQELWASKRTTYLFEKVFPVLTASVWRNEGLQEFPVKDVVNCRGVCKTWNADIDKLIDKFCGFGNNSVESDFRIRLSFGDVREKTFVFCWPINEENDIPAENTCIHRFLSHFEKTHGPTNQSKGRNPFVWGIVSIEMGIGGEDEEAEECHRFMNGVSLMLSKYGSHIQVFSLTIYSNGAFENATWLHEWLLQIPNQKEFNVVNHGNYDTGDINLDDYPIPNVTFLEKMCITGVPSSTFNQLIRQNTNMSVLYVDYTIDYDVFTVPLPNLISFDTSHCPNDIVARLGSPLIQWPLEALQLERVQLVMCAPLFRAIQRKFSSTLVSLRLGIAKGADDVLLWQDCKNLRLDLPKLRDIWFDTGKRPVCLDFLLPMKHNLEKVSASYAYHTPCSLLHSDMGIVQNVGFEERMLDSNIWAIFTKLEKFEVLAPPPGWWHQAQRDYFRKDWIMNNMYNV